MYTFADVEIPLENRPRVNIHKVDPHNFTVELVTDANFTANQLRECYIGNVVAISVSIGNKSLIFDGVLYSFEMRIGQSKVTIENATSEIV